MTRTKRIELAAILAVVLALLGYSRIREHGESPAVEEQTAITTGEASREETAKAGVQTTEGDPVGSGAGHTTSRTSAGTPGSSKGSRPGGSLTAGSPPEGSIPRGFEIAFTRGGDIHLMNADGSDRRVLGPGAEPGWSPDGKLIAFIRYIDGGDVRLMNADGSGLRNLRVGGFSPTWSPDGGQLAFGWACHAQPGETCSIEGFWPTDPVEDCGPECGIGVVARDGTGVRHLGNGIWPEWGPDGRIMFADGIATPCFYDQGTGWTRAGSPPPQCELPIWVMNPDGSGRTKLPVDKAIRPTWSPDGRRIAYSTATNEIFIPNSDGTGIAKVAPGGGSWSPDSLWLALRGRDGIYLRGVDGSAERRLTSGAYDSLPAVSPWR